MPRTAGGATGDPAPPPADDGRPGDDPEQTPWHFGFRFIWFWLMPLVVVGGAVLVWTIIDEARVDGFSPRDLRFLVLYPIGVVAWVAGLVGYRRAKRRGLTPIPGSYKPRRRSAPTGGR